jgi:hypothetical protein
VTGYVNGAIPYADVDASCFRVLVSVAVLFKGIACSVITP